MHKSFLILLLGLCAFAVRGEVADSITVAGRVVNIPAGKSCSVRINECDISVCDQRPYVDLDSAGYFRQRIPLSYPHTFTVCYDRRLFVNAFAEPGDSIYMEIDGTSLKFDVSGDKADLNGPYSQAHEDLAKIFWDVELPPDTVPLAEYMASFKSNLDKLNDTATRYIEEKNLSDEVAEFIYADNLYGLANMAIGYCGTDSLEKKAFFTDPIFDFRNEKNTRVMIFPYHLIPIVHHAAEVVDDMPKGLVRDIMYAIMAGEGALAPREAFSNPAYHDRIYSYQAPEIDLSYVKPGKFYVLDNGAVTTCDDANAIEWIKKRFKGRPVYVDVSATWCGPCRAGLLGSQDVREYFRNSDVGFVVLWLNSDMEQWKAIAPKITNAVQIFVESSTVSENISRALALQAYPSYYLMNREGEIEPTETGYLSNDLPELLKAQ